jgi:DNA-binding SARP family transcriptional activator
MGNAGWGGPSDGAALERARLPSPPPGALRLTLFDGWRLTRGGCGVHVPVRGQRLVALLALRGPQTRALVGGTLWPEASEQRAQTSVRAALWALHQQAPGLVEAGGSEIGLADDLSVDVEDFLTNAWLLLHPRESSLLGTSSTWLPLVGSPGGRLLPGWYDDWVLVERERIHQLRLHALEALTDLLIEHGDYAEALECALTAVAVDPHRESAHRLVMRVHLAEGNAAEALRESERFRRLLRESFGIEPSRQMAELVERIRAQPQANRRRVIARGAPLHPVR